MSRVEEELSIREKEVEESWFYVVWSAKVFLQSTLLNVNTTNTVSTILIAIPSTSIVLLSFIECSEVIIVEKEVMEVQKYFSLSPYTTTSTQHLHYTHRTIRM